MQKNSYKPCAHALLVSLALMLTLCACESQPMDSIKEQDKWQPAEFVSMVTTTPVNVPLVFDCRKGSDTQSSVNKQFALVKQRNYANKFVHTERYWVVPAGGLSALKAGEEVLVDIQDCEPMRVSINLSGASR